MNVGGAIRAIISFLIFVVLHYTLRPLLGWRAPMDFLVLALLLAAVRVRPSAAAVIGFVLGFAMMLPGHIFGGTGAGDVKLFAAAGAVVGAQRIVPAFVFMAIAGGALALGIAWWRGRLWHTMKSTARLCGRPAATKAVIERPSEHNRFPYGPAIAVGCVIAALM